MSKNRIDIMVDIETLGNETESTIIQIAAMAFDIKTGEVKDKFNMIADIEKNELPISATGGTIKWWLNTNAELLKELLNEGKVSSEDMIKYFHGWMSELRHKEAREKKDLTLTGDLYLWGNGILFDNKIIQHHMESIGLEYPIFYRNDRDVRTIVDLAGAKSGLSEKELKAKFNDESLVAHNAFDDVVYQISLVSGCYNMLIK